MTTTAKSPRLCVSVVQLLRHHSGMALLLIFVSPMAAAAQRSAPPATFFEPLGLMRARQEEQEQQRELQRAAEGDASHKKATAKAAAEKAAANAAAANVVPRAWLCAAGLVAQAATEKADAAKAAAEKTAAEKAAAEKAAAAKAAAAKAAAADRDAAQNAQVQQYIQLLQPTLWTELDFIRQVCDLAPEQRPKIKEAGEASLKQAARDIGMPRAAAQRQQRTQIGAAQTIRAALAQALKETLSAEQFDRFSQEADARIAHRKQAAILGVVSRLDSLLCLNTDQRDKMVDSINSKWQPEWEQWLMLHQYGGQYYPQIPDAHVAPLLNAEQKTVWSSVQKISVNSWGGGDGRARDTAWWDGKGKNDQ